MKDIQITEVGVQLGASKEYQSAKVELRAKVLGTDITAADAINTLAEEAHKAVQEQLGVLVGGTSAKAVKARPPKVVRAKTSTSKAAKEVSIPKPKEVTTDEHRALLDRARKLSLELHQNHNIPIERISSDTTVEELKVMISRFEELKKKPAKKTLAKKTPAKRPVKVEEEEGGEYDDDYSDEYDEVDIDGL